MKSSAVKRSDGLGLLADLERVKPSHWTLNGWAVAAGVSRTIWTDIRRHGNPSRKTLEKLLLAANSSLAEFEALRIGAPHSLPASDRPLALAEPAIGWRGPSQTDQTPIVGIPQGKVRFGDATVPTFRLSRPFPAALESRRYMNGRVALSVCVANMEPRFGNGRAVAVSLSADAQAGDDVLVGLSPRQGGKGDPIFLLAHLVGKTKTTLQLRQYDPREDYDLPVDHVEVAAKVLGEIF